MELISIIWVELLGHYSKQKSTLSDVARLLEEPGSRKPKPRRPKQVQHRLRVNEQAELIERYLAGERAHDLAAAYGLHRNTVADLLTTAGLRRPRSMTKDEIAESVQLYQTGWSCARIGNHLGRDDSTVWLALKAAGVRLRDPHGRER
jgi:hypothetical protein